MNGFFHTDLIGDQNVPIDAKGALVIVHGLGKHRGRYQSAVTQLAACGIACFTYDQRGHGESSGPRTDVVNFSDFTNDLTNIVNGVIASYPNLPIFLWGHSLGSIVVLNYALDFQTGLRGGITTGCPLAALPKVATVFDKVGSKLCNILPTIRINCPINPKLLSHVEEVQFAYQRDQLVTKSVTLKLVFELSQAISKFKKHSHKIKIPWYALHGEEDHIAPVRGSKQLIDLLSSKDKMLTIMDGLRHEIHNETTPEQEKFFGLITNWIIQRL